MVDRPEPLNGQIPVAAAEARELAVAVPQLRPQGQRAPNAERLPKDYPFTGQLVLGVEPLLIGERNYAVLRNFRYRDAGIRTVNGYSSIIHTPHPIYPRGRTGIQLIKLIHRQPQSHLLVHATTADGTSRAVLLSMDAIPQHAGWQATPLWVDGPGAGDGRFSFAPDGNIAYCNEVESTIWGSPEHRVGAFLVHSAAGGLVRDYTGAVQSTVAIPAEVASLHITPATAPLVLLGSPRPLQGFTLYVHGPNALPRSLAVDYWGAGGWTPVVGLADGTRVGTVSLAQTGPIGFASTVGAARVKYENDTVLYWYRLRWDGPVSVQTSVSYVTVHAPWQPVTDVWDGVPRPIAAAHKVAPGGDITREVTERDGVSADIGALPTTGHLLIGFSEPTMALRWILEAGNTAGTGPATVSFWNGSGWVPVANFFDGTYDGQFNNSLAATATMSWTPAAPGTEFPQDLFGVPAYYYRVSWGAALSAGVKLDQLLGIPGPRTLHGFRFPFRFQNRLFLMGDLLGNEGHAAEYCLTNAPDVWNGDQTSARGQRLYFGDNAQDSLRAAAEIYNRFAGSLAYLAVVCSDTRTWLLSGSGPETFQIFPVSSNLGCPAPETMTSIEVAYSVAEDAQRNVAIWLSAHGPVLFDGSVILPIPGLEPFFDPDDPRAINPTALRSARAWYVHGEKTWHVTFPSGAGAPRNTVEMAYDLRRQRWYEVAPADYLQGAIPVVDAHGTQYVYGLLDTGHAVRMEHGHSWREQSGIQAEVVLGDLLPAGSGWVQTRLRRHQLVAKRKGGTPVNVSVEDLTDRGTTLLGSLDVTSGSGPYARRTQPANVPGWTHRLRYRVFVTDAAVELLTWSGLFTVDREER